MATLRPRKKRGRPPLPNAKRRWLDVRMSTEERELLARAAKHVGLPLTVWARDVLVKAAERVLK